MGRHPNPQKGHRWVRTRHFSHKRLKFVEGFEPGVIARKKYNQDRTGQDNKKSHKSIIFHIFGGKLPVKLLQWNLARGSYVGKVWSLKFKGCKFYRGLKFWLLHWLCLWDLHSVALLHYLWYEVGTLAVDGWPVTFGTERRGLGGPQLAQAPPRIPNVTAHPSTLNSQCINHSIPVLWPVAHRF